MERMLDQLALAGPMVLGLAIAVAFVIGGYLVITIDRGRSNSPSKDDTQAGLKLVLIALALAGVSMAVVNVESVVAMMLGGFHEFVAVVKSSIVGIVVGGGVAVGIVFGLLPKTNIATSRQPERFALGVLALQYGLMTIFAVYMALSAIVFSASWAETSGSLAGTVIYGAVGLIAIMRFGATSGWVVPPPRPPMQPPMAPMQPPPGAGYPPPGGGYPPPQGGGYPPQGGGGYGGPQGGGGGGYGPPTGGNPYQPR
jgi:hypothetical protein|nr:hypothetical protein [Kofleriaceae bacterium]